MSAAIWLVGVFGAAALTAGAAVALGLRLGGLDRLHPRSRARLYAALAFAPLCVGALVLAATFVPQTWLGLPDHCLSHGHHLHLCVSCGLPTPPALFSALAILYAAWVGWGLARRLAELARARAAMARLAGAPRPDGTVVLPIPGLVAFVAGFARPRIFVSEAACARRWSAVRAHERDHARHRDPLVRLLARLALVVAPPGLAGSLARRLGHAQELAADEAAAEAIGDRLAVADQVLAWTRARRAEPPLALAFGDSDVERRVRALLDRPRYVSAPGYALGALAGALAVLVGLTAPSIHHGVEELLHLLDHTH